MINYFESREWQDDGRGAGGARAFERPHDQTHQKRCAQVSTTPVVVE